MLAKAMERNVPSDPASTAMVMAALLPLHQTVMEPAEIAVCAAAASDCWFVCSSMMWILVVLARHLERSKNKVIVFNV